MSRIAYVNGRYVRHAEAGISIDDRAVNFGDGVYEVCEVRGGALIDEARHMARLARSLEALRAREAFISSATNIAMPVVAIDGQPIGDGKPGPVTLALRRRFHEVAARS